MVRVGRTTILIQSVTLNKWILVFVNDFIKVLNEVVADFSW